jgi:hypothetical protein
MKWWEGIIRTGYIQAKIKFTIFLKEPHTLVQLPLFFDLITLKKIRSIFLSIEF